MTNERVGRLIISSGLVPRDIEKIKDKLNELNNLEVTKETPMRLDLYKQKADDEISLDLDLDQED